MFYQPEKTISKTENNLPHWQQEQVWIFVTFRLADALPIRLLNKWQEHRSAWLSHNPPPRNERQESEYHQLFSEKIDSYLDANYGSCLLQKPENSAIVANALHHFDNQRYLLQSFVVMPNHIHILFSPHEGHSLSDIIHSWKRFTAREINKMEKRRGPLWQPDYWDRLIRHEAHFKATQTYIHRNPKRLPTTKYRFYERE
ncbi:MAG: transposase [Roseibacillus sp.]